MTPLRLSCDRFDMTRLRWGIATPITAIDTSVEAAELAFDDVIDRLGLQTEIFFADALVLSLTL